MKEQILSHLTPGHPWGENLIWFDETDSTNTQAKALASAGAPHGTVLIADRQTGGRGRMGRSFLSPGGVGIYMSVILRPNCRPDQLMHLTCATAVTMCDALEASTGLRPGIKWINDLVFEKQKLGGILTEMALDTRTGLVQYAIVGIGINCCQKKGDFPQELPMAASLSMVLHKEIDRSKVAAAMIEALENMGRSLLSEKHAIMDRYRRDCITVGQDVSVHGFDAVRHGRALSVDDDGAMTVEFLDGHTESVHAGEVSVRGMFGYV